jgi:hypothetical protein
MLNTVLMILLQEINSQDLDKVVSQLTKSSVDLAEATYNFGALRVAFGIFAIFTILILLLFIYQIVSLNSKIITIHNAATKTQEFFEGVSDRTIGKIQAQVLIRRSFNCLSQSLKYSIIRIRLENHIDNKDAILDKVRRLVDNEFSELSAFYSNFMCDEKPIGDIVKDEDAEIIKEFIVEQIYIPKEEFSLSTMDQSVSIFLNGIKLEYIKSL